MKFKVGDKVKLIYHHGNDIYIYVGIIGKIQKNDNLPNNPRIFLKRNHYYITNNNIKIIKKECGPFFIYSRIEKIIDIKSEIFFEVL